MSKNLDNRLSKLEAHRQPAQKPVHMMTDSELCDIIRQSNPAYRDLTDDEISTTVAANILQAFDELGIHPSTVTPDEWQRIKDAL